MYLYLYVYKSMVQPGHLRTHYSVGNNYSKFRNLLDKDSFYKY